jgi:hypothetical protein
LNSAGKEDEVTDLLSKVDETTLLEEEKFLQRFLQRSMQKDKD